MGRGALLAGALAVVVGCRHCDITPPARPAAAQLAIVKRGKIEPDPASLPTVLKVPTRPEQYRNLTAVECRTLAIANAPLADDLDTHPASDPRGHFASHRHRGPADLSREVRGFAADELRNRAAADALEDYYKLAAAEGQFDLLIAGHSILQKHRE